MESLMFMEDFYTFPHRIHNILIQNPTPITSIEARKLRALTA
jgi:hypothetical protein